MKKIFAVLIFLPGLAFSISEATVLGNKVNIREEASINSKIVTRLNESEQVEILERSTKTNMIGSYLGSWLKIRFSKDKTGYIFSSFLLESGQTSEQKFHIFFQKFLRNNIKGRVSSVKKMVQFPLDIETCYPSSEDSKNERDCSQKMITIKQFDKTLTMKDPMYEMVFKIKGDKIELNFGYEGLQDYFYFKYIDGQWKLVSITYIFD